MSEPVPEYLKRKIHEIEEMIEAGTNAGAVAGFEIKDTCMNNNGIITPVIILTVTINEGVLKKWKENK